MAITNAQQYQQLVNKPANGKRPGYRGQGSKETRDNRQTFDVAQAAANVGKASTAPTVSYSGSGDDPVSRGGPQDLGFEAQGIGPYAPGAVGAYQVIGGNKYAVIPGDEQNRIDRKILEDIERKKYEEEVKQFIDEGKEFESGIPTVVGKFVDAFGRFNNPKQRAWFAKNVANNKYGYTLENYDEYEEKRRKGEINAYGRPLTDLEKQLAQGNKDGPDTGDLILREQGIMNQASETTDQETDDEDEDLRLAFRADGGRIGFRGGDAARSDIASGRNAGRADPSGGVERPSGGGGGGDNNQTVITPVKIPKPIQDVGNTAGELMFLKNVIELNPVGIMKNIGTKLILDKLISEADTEDQNTMLADGGRIGAAEGGIMDLETGRQMYFLGKLVKKATRAVKKIAKSPIGKIALLYAGTAGLGALGAGAARAGTGLGIFSPSNVLSNVGTSFLKFKGTPIGESIFGKALGDTDMTRSGGILNKALGFATSPFGLITTASAIAGALTPEQEDQAQQLADETGIDIEKARNAILQAAKENYAMDVRARGFKADGGLMRLGYQEGGDAEPVAKKTLPLLDMGGKEKDYRETGGFVDMGRMERADDVPARLSKNEFVFTADAVRNAGDGSVDKGAEVMYNMMKNLEAGGEVSEESQGLEGARRMFQTSQRLEEVL